MGGPGDGQGSLMVVVAGMSAAKCDESYWDIKNQKLTFFIVSRPPRRILFFFVDCKRAGRPADAGREAAHRLAGTRADLECYLQRRQASNLNLFLF